jgi:uncharacterized membrane protein YebE (DUF533 family)
MQTPDRAPLVAIAMLAARADGRTDSAEQKAVEAVVRGVGDPDVTWLAEQVASGRLRVAELAARLSDEEARRAAYEGALAVIHADGAADPRERAFLDELRGALGLSARDVAAAEETAGAVVETPVTPARAGAAPGATDDLILQQAVLTGALEVLPDRLASLAILPLQLRLVFQIGQEHGQKLDLDQVKDLAATLGLGAATQGVQGAVLKLVGGLAGGLLGGLGRGAARVATGAAITFAATYALGHVADQYYRQGRRLDAADLRALFARFQEDARTIYPRVEGQIRSQAGSLDLGRLLGSLRGS